MSHESITRSHRLMPSTPAHPPPPYHRTYKRFGVLHTILVKTCCCCLVVYVMLAVVFVSLCVVAVVVPIRSITQLLLLLFVMCSPSYY